MRELKLLTGKRVVVMTDATTLDGVIESATRSALVLTDAMTLDGPQPVPVDGSVLIPVPKINYVQVA